MNEKLSAFLDNEASKNEMDAVIHGLLTNPEQRESWSRQHWLRTTLRASQHEPAVGLDLAFASRVMSAVTDTDAKRAKARPTADIAMPRVAHRGRRRWRGVIGTVAVASLAGVVVLTYRPLTGVGVHSAGSGVQASANRSGETRTAADTHPAFGLDASSMPRSLTRTAAGQYASSYGSATAQDTSTQRVAGSGRSTGAHAGWSVSNPNLRNELNGYLVEHNGLARGYRLAASAPSMVRVATYGSQSTQ